MLHEAVARIAERLNQLLLEIAGDRMLELFRLVVDLVPLGDEDFGERAQSSDAD